MKSITSKQPSGLSEGTPKSESSPAAPPRFELWILVGLGLIAFLHFAQSVILPVVLSCVAALALRPLMHWLTRHHIPRVISALLVMSFFVALAGVIISQLEGPVVQWVNRAPEYRERLQKFSDKLLHPDRKTGQEPAGKPPESKPNPPAPAHAPISIDYKTILAWTGATLTQSVEVMVLLFLMLISKTGFSQQLERMLPNSRGRRWAAESISQIQRNISAYLFTISAINVVLGLAVGGGLAVLGFPNATMWGVMAALLNYIPYFGPIVGIILVGLVSFFTQTTIPKEVLPMCWYLALHILEADLFTPILLGRRFTMNPVIILVSLMFWTWLWGVPGALLAVPLQMSLKVICERMSFSKIGELFEDEPGEVPPKHGGLPRARDAAAHATRLD